MATFNVALLIILIGIWLCASSIRADEQQNKTENGEDIKHLFGLDEIRENQNLIAEKMLEISAKLEQIENGKCNNQNALFHFHLPIYRWNATDCHPKIVINESTNAIQRNATGTEAPIQIMPSAAASGRIGIIYTEYRIIAGNGPTFIGLSSKEMTLDHWLGYEPVSYGYANFGRIESTNANGNYENISDNVPSFRIGDMVGCGLNWATRQVFFTKNGQRLNITNLYIEEDTADLYPTVSLNRHGDVVEANFGPIFKYDLSNEF
ncbi:hypothetical protein niasHT_000834 [Heterodera trifolii]|uniref:B30.2/SPRY domain-containing protein n=1 Tax=Heterodera trifolii TaxID=157864 RepID=A0ABD2MAN1_9BILA